MRPRRTCSRASLGRHSGGERISAQEGRSRSAGWLDEMDDGRQRHRPVSTMPHRALGTEEILEIRRLRMNYTPTELFQGLSMSGLVFRWFHCQTKGKLIQIFWQSFTRWQKNFTSGNFFAVCPLPYSMIKARKWQKQNFYGAKFFTSQVKLCQTYL